MHILYLQQLLVLPGSPGHTRSYEMAVSWVKAGHKVSILTTDTYFQSKISSRQAHTFEIEGVHIQAFPIRYSHMMSFPRRIWAFLSYYRSAWRWGKTYTDADLVIAYSAPLSTGMLGRRLARFHNLPFIFEVADVWPDVPVGMGIIRNPWLIRWLHRKTRQIYDRAQAIWPFSEGMKAQIESHGIAPEKIHVFPNGARLETPSLSLSPNAPGTPIEVLYAGTVGIANGVEQFVEAIGKIEAQGRTDIRFTIMGAGNRLKQVKQYASELGIQQLQFISKVPREEFQAHIRNADIAIVSYAPYPVLEANGSTKFFDYLAVGLPIVLNYQGWQAHYLEKYACGLFSEQGDVDTFVQNILTLADQPELRFRMGHNGRLLAESLFDRKKIQQQVLIQLEQVYHDFQQAPPSLS